jgi:hypothetical protein
MDPFLELPDERRRALCEEAHVRLSLAPVSIEKDFWVCWTLRELFGLPGWGPHLTFKGGTSLSKAWDLIARFSEDIDIVIDRDVLGFGGIESPEAASSRKQRKVRLEALKAECQRRIHAEMLPALRARFRQILPTRLAWDLAPATADEDPDQQTLLFQYPSVMAVATGYVRPLVKIEMGARSDTEPAESPVIRPYLADAFPALLGPSDVQVRALAPERTFWEKAMLLHEETYRPAGRARKARLARHYYDLWCLITKGVAARAVASPGLFERVATHREVFFNWSWMDYSSLQAGRLRLVPLEAQLPEWRHDYESMSREMFAGDVPAFDEVLRVVGGFERDLNLRGGSTS